MSTHNIQFHYQKEKLLNICFLELSEEFCRDSKKKKKKKKKKKRVRISHGKRAIGVRAIEVRLYIDFVTDKFQQTTF